MTQARQRKHESKLHAFVAICITVFVLWAAYEVLMPVALSVLLAFLLAPIVLRLERHGLPAVWAVIATVTVAFALIAGLSYAVGTQLYNLGELLQEKETQKQIVAKGASIKKVFGGSGGIGDKIAEIGAQIDQESAKATTQLTATRPADDAGLIGSAKEAAGDPVPVITRTDRPVVGTTRPAVAPVGTAEKPFYTVALPPPPTPIELVGRYMGTILAPLGTAGLVIIFTVFVLLEREQLRDRMIRLLSGGNYTNTTAAINDATGRISRYMVAQAIVNGSYGVIIAIALWLIGATLGDDRGVRAADGVRVEGFPSFVLWGLLCATLRFIPYVGPWVAAAFPIVLSLAVFEGFTVFAVVVATFVVIELFSNNVMEPWLYGSSTGLSTFAILVAAVFWTWLWGPIGLLLSTPLTVCIVVLGRYTAQLEFLDVLLSDRQALPQPVRFYQRLLAGDEVEATDIVKESAAETDWGRAGDAVVVPAIALARRDRRNEDLTAEIETRLLDSMITLAEKFRAKLEEVEAKAAEARAAEAAKAAEAEAKEREDVEPDAEPTPPAAEAAPLAPVVRPVVLAFPAHHRSEEAALKMLPLGPEMSRVAITVGSTRLLAAHVVDKVARERPAVVVIGVVPPGGLLQARYLCRRLKRRWPEVHIIVAYFGRPRDFDALLMKLRSSGATYVTTSIEQTQRQLIAMLNRPADAAPAPAPAPAHLPKVIDPMIPPPPAIDPSLTHAAPAGGDQ